MKPAQGYLADDGTFFEDQPACIMHDARRALAITLEEAGFDPGVVMPLVLGALSTFKAFILAAEAVLPGDEHVAPSTIPHVPFREPLTLDEVVAALIKKGVLKP